MAETPEVKETQSAPVSSAPPEVRGTPVAPSLSAGPAPSGGTSPEPPQSAPGSAAPNPPAQDGKTVAPVPSSPVEEGGIVKLKRRLLQFKEAIRIRFTQKGYFMADLPEIFQSVRSPDLPTRRMSVLFILCCVGFFVVLTWSLVRRGSAHRKASLKQAHLEEKRLEKVARRGSIETTRLASTLSLGDFQIELKEGIQPGVTSNLAEMEVVVFCDRPETQTYIKENKDLARNQVTQALLSIDREFLMSREGKRKLKLALVKKLNEWLKEGRVEDVFFPRLIVN